MVNYAKMGFKMAQADFQLGADIMNMTGNWLSSDMKQRQLEQQAKNMSLKAVEFAKSAGNTQQQGRQEREQVGLRAGAAKGDAFSSAAGSGIDVSSKIVGKVVSEINTQADNARRQSAFNERERAQNDINRMLEAKEEEVALNLSKKLEKNNQRIALAGGALSAVANWSGTMGEAFS